MHGVYKVYKSGLLVATKRNLITTRGRGLILQHLAGSIGTFAGVLVAGTSQVAPVISNTKLGFEFMRAPVSVSAAEIATNKVIYKATMPLNDAGIVYEIGLYPELRTTASDYAGQVFIGFDPILEGLTGGTLNTVNYRVGVDSYTVNAAVSASTTVLAGSTRGNFGIYSGTDTFSLAYFLNDANTSSILVRLKVDNANFFTYTINTNTTIGYQVSDWNKNAFVSTGTPSWDNINNAEFIVTARASGATVVQLDGLRINDNDIYPDYALVSRAVLGTPIIKGRGEQMDIEYALEFNI